MRPYRSTIFSRINRINHMNKILKEDKRMRRYDIVAAIGAVLMIAIAFSMVCMTVLVAFGIL